MNTRIPTASQTVGPFFAEALVRPGQDSLTTQSGGRIRIVGRVLDGEAQPVTDAMIEVWQPDERGRFVSADGAAEAFAGFGRTATDDQGGFAFDTVKPGAVPDLQGRKQAPHVGVNVFARGVLRRLYTRIYFADEPANAHDPVLSSIASDPARRSLIAALIADGPVPTYRFDIVLQGDTETAFFDI